MGKKMGLLLIYYMAFTENRNKRESHRMYVHTLAFRIHPLLLNSMYSKIKMLKISTSTY